MTQNKYYLNALIIPFFFVFSSNMAMLTSLLKPAVKNVNKSQEDKESARIKQLTTITSVDREINVLKNNVYKEGLTELASLTNKPYDSLQQEIDKKRAFVKQELRKNSYSHKNHDPNIPSSMYQQLTDAMSEMQIHPNNIDLEYITSSEQSGLLASAKSGSYFYDHCVVKPRIRIYNELSKHSNDSQNFTYHHELQHILLEHSSIQSMVSLCNSSYDRSHKPELTSIQEREADIHAASINIHNARIGIQNRCVFGHKKIINHKKHCEEMITMYALMKQKEKLSRKKRASRF